MAKRFEEHGESYFLFVNDPSIAPSNNFAERDIRTLVMDRIVTQGVRSEGGNQWHERFWTTIATSGEYPLSRPLYLFTNGYPKLGSPLMRFCNFYLTEEGQEVITAKGFVPLTNY